MTADCFIIHWSAFPSFLVQFFQSSKLGFRQFSNRARPQFSNYKYIVLFGQYYSSIVFIATGIKAKKLLNYLNTCHSQ